MGICYDNRESNVNRRHSSNNVKQNMINNEKSPINENISFRCTYEVIDTNNDIQIINNTDGIDINEEIELKIKILNNGQKENLVLKKKFDKTGKNIIDFVIEGKLNNMSFMFNKCFSLKSIDFISFETGHVINMSGMFQHCNELEYLDLSKFNTSNIIDMSFMFNGCHKLKKIKGIDNFNTTNVTNMKAMFQQCNELKYLDLSKFNTSNIIDISWMFNKCHKLKEIKGLIISIQLKFLIC